MQLFCWENLPCGGLLPHIQRDISSRGNQDGQQEPGAVHWADKGHSETQDQPAQQRFMKCEGQIQNLPQQTHLGF